MALTKRRGGQRLAGDTQLIEQRRLAHTQPARRLDVGQRGQPLEAPMIVTLAQPPLGHGAIRALRRHPLQSLQGVRREHGPDHQRGRRQVVAGDV